MAHSGPKASGSFVQTLVLTDIATGWTECAPLLVREQGLLVEVLTEIREHLPFAVRPGRCFGSGSTPSRSGPAENCSSGCRLTIPASTRTGSCGHSSVASKDGGEKLRGDWSSRPQRWSLALRAAQKRPLPQPNDPSRNRPQYRYVTIYYEPQTCPNSHRRRSE